MMNIVSLHIVGFVVRFQQKINYVIESMSLSYVGSIVAYYNIMLVSI